jgi:N-acetylmuramoyl-L-alanine amidase
MLLIALALAALPSPALAQKIFLDPSDQYSNPVSGGNVEAYFANDNANRAAAKIGAAGFSTRVVEGLSAAVDSANAWPADIFISIHTNAGGGHGTETWYYTGSGSGQRLAGMAFFQP